MNHWVILLDFGSLYNNDNNNNNNNNNNNVHNNTNNNNNINLISRKVHRVKPGICMCWFFF